MRAASGIFAFTTSNYDAMKAFFCGIGMEIREDAGDQLVPIFNTGRGASVSRGDIHFNLEESTSGQASARFNLFLTGYPVSELHPFSSLGYDFSTEVSLYGTFHTLTSPDGGQVTIAE